MSEAIAAMRWAFMQLSNGNVFVPNRLSMDIPDKNATTLVMPAYVLGSPYYIVKIVSVNYSNPHKGKPLINATVHVFDVKDGKQAAMLMQLLPSEPGRPQDWQRTCWPVRM